MHIDDIGDVFNKHICQCDSFIKMNAKCIEQYVKQYIQLKSTKTTGTMLRNQHFQNGAKQTHT